MNNSGQLMKASDNKPSVTFLLTLYKPSNPCDNPREQVLFSFPILLTRHLRSAKANNLPKATQQAGD